MEFLLYAGIIHFALAIVAFIFIVRSPLYEKKQKLRQFLFAGLVPLLGPAVTILIFWGDRGLTERPPQRMMGDSIDEHYRKYRGGLF
jgi:hypothetical protein